MCAAVSGYGTGRSSRYVAVIFLAAVALVAYWERGWVCARWVHWATRFEANYGVRPDAVCAEYR